MAAIDLCRRVCVRRQGVCMATAHVNKRENINKHIGASIQTLP